MGSHAGLKKVQKTVKGKHGMVKRSYWVRATAAVKGAGKRVGKFARAHEVGLKRGAKIAGAVVAAAALAKGGHYAHKNAGKIVGAALAAHGSMKVSGAFNRLARAAGATDAHIGLRARIGHAIGDAKVGAKLGHIADRIREDLRSPNPESLGGPKGRTVVDELHRDQRAMR